MATTLAVLFVCKRSKNGQNVDSSMGPAQVPCRLLPPYAAACSCLCTSFSRLKDLTIQPYCPSNWPEQSQVCVTQLVAFCVFFFRLKKLHFEVYLRKRVETAAAMRTLHTSRMPCTRALFLPKVSAWDSRSLDSAPPTSMLSRGIPLPSLPPGIHRSATPSICGW